MLQKVQGNSFSYSIWYGQHISAEADAVHKDNILREVYSVQHLSDLGQLPPVLSYDDVWADFAKTFDGGSGVSVVDLTHFVWIFRRFIEKLGPEEGPTRMKRLRLRV